MASYTADRAVNKTLSTTVVDVVTLDQPHGEVWVLNRSSGAAVIWVTSGAFAPVDPAAAGDDSIPVAAGEKVKVGTGTQAKYMVKVVGSGDSYSVYGGPR